MTDYKEAVEVERVFAMSDIHTDHPENMRWIESLSKTSYQKDCAVVAGDVSDSTAILEQTLRALRDRFRAVFFVPGNHDLWLRRGEESCSLVKLSRLQEMCSRCGVFTTPQRLRTNGKWLWVVPILSWHHKEFDYEPDIVGWKGIVKVHRLMVDFTRCKWGELNDRTDSVAQHLDRMNDEHCPPGFSWSTSMREAGDMILSFSHFLPRLELCPEKRYLYHPNLPKAVGSNYLKARVARLQPHVHVFGHTHFGWDAEIDGVRYIQAALAYPHERDQRPQSLEVGSHCISDRGPLLVWDGRWVGKLGAWWSEHYEKTPRNPDNNTELAPYVASRYIRRQPGEPDSDCE